MGTLFYVLSLLLSEKYCYFHFIVALELIRFQSS